MTFSLALARGLELRKRFNVAVATFGNHAGNPKFALTGEVQASLIFMRVASRQVCIAGISAWPDAA